MCDSLVDATLIEVCKSGRMKRAKGEEGTARRAEASELMLSKSKKEVIELTDSRRVEENLRHSESLVIHLKQLLLLGRLLRCRTIDDHGIHWWWRCRRRCVACWWWSDKAELVGGVGEEVGEDVGTDDGVGERGAGAG